MGRLADKVAIITGASAGIGRATALLFAAEGASLVLGARRGNELEQLVAEVQAKGGKATALAGDVRSEDYAKDLVALAVERFGRLDIAFNNAGTLGEAGRQHRRLGSGLVGHDRDQPDRHRSWAPSTRSRRWSSMAPAR